MSAIRLAIVVLVLAVVAAVVAPRFAPDVMAWLVDLRRPTEVAAAPDRAGRPMSPPPHRAVADRSPLRRDVGRRVVLDADRRGHFLVDATINGRAMEALVDTGASAVALTAESARRLGIVPFREDYTVTVSTADGTVRAAPVTLTEIRVGGIRVCNVDALVMPSGALPGNLLGMSFLARLTKFEFAGPQLVLMQ